MVYCGFKYYEQFTDILYYLCFQNVIIHRNVAIKKYQCRKIIMDLSFVDDYLLVITIKL